MVDIPRKAILAQVGETVVVVVMSPCCVGCLGQARKRCCSNRCCCGGLRNYASDVRPTDPLAVGVESPSQTLAHGVVSCTATTAGLKYIKNTSAVRSTRVVIGTTRNMFDFSTSCF